MIVPTDPEYIDTKLVKQGVKQLEPPFRELADWINENFRTEVLNIYYDRLDTDNNRPWLNIIFEYDKDAEKFKDSIGNFDSSKQWVVSQRFNKLHVPSSARSNYCVFIFQKTPWKEI